MNIVNKIIDKSGKTIKKSTDYIGKHGGDIVRKGADHVSKHAPEYAVGGTVLAAGYAAKKYLFKK